MSLPTATAPSHTGSCSPRQRWELTFLWCTARTACPPDIRITVLTCLEKMYSHLHIRFWIILSTFLVVHLLELGEVWLGSDQVSPRPPQLLLPPLGLGQLRLDLVQDVAGSLASHWGSHWRRNFWHGLKLLKLISYPRHHVCLSLSYFVNLRFSQLNNCVRLLEGRYFASVSDEVLHNSWSRWQDHGPIQIWIELLLTK